MSDRSSDGQCSIATLARVSRRERASQSPRRSPRVAPGFPGDAAFVFFSYAFFAGGVGPQPNSTGLEWKFRDSAGFENNYFKSLQHFSTLTDVHIFSVWNTGKRNLL
jgi:hypothetical protein